MFLRFIENESSKAYVQNLLASTESVQMRQAYVSYRMYWWRSPLEVNAERNTRTGPQESNFEYGKHRHVVMVISKRNETSGSKHWKHLKCCAVELPGLLVMQDIVKIKILSQFSVAIQENCKRSEIGSGGLPHLLSLGCYEMSFQMYPFKGQ